MGFPREIRFSMTVRRRLALLLEKKTLRAFYALKGKG